MSSRQVGSAHLDISARTKGVVTGMEEARRKTREAAREMRAEVKEATGTISLLGEEIGVKLPRHLRTFVAQLPGVASALSAAFSGAAIVGLGMIAVEQAKKIYEAWEKLKELPETIHSAFEKTTSAIEQNNDALIVQNAQLQNAINKFKGAPENKLAEQLAEATAAAVKLGDTLVKVNEEIVKTLNAGKVNIFEKLWGIADTDDVTKQLKDLLHQSDEITVDYDAKLRAAREAGDKDRLDALQKAEGFKQQAIYEQAMALTKKEIDARKELAKQTGVTTLTDQTSAIETLEGVYSSLAAAREQNALATEHNALAEEKAGETGPSAGDRAKAEAEAAAKALHFREEGYKKGLEAYAKYTEDIRQHQEETETQYLTVDQAMWKQIGEQFNKAAAQQKRSSEEQTKDAIAAERTKQAQIAATYEQIAEDQNYLVQTGQESNQERLANLEIALEQEYAAREASLTREQAQYEQGSKDWLDIQREKWTTYEQMSRQANAIATESMNAGIQGAFNQIIVKSQDTAGAMREVFTQAINSMNDQLVNLMTGKKANFAAMFEGIAGTVGHAALTKLEGTALGALHLGKADGSQSNPFWTKSADDLKKAATEVGSKLGGSPDTTTAIDNAGGMWGHLIGGLTGLFGLQHGGPAVPGSAYLVGEHGPELFTTGTRGTITSNAALNRLGSSSYSHHTSIDARGSSDPAAVNAAVHRAMRNYIPVMVGASYSFQKDQGRRVPPTAKT